MNHCKPLNLFIFSLLFLFSGILLTAGNLRAQSNEDCYMCHEDATLKKEVQGKTISLYVNSKVINNSVHRKVSCVSCHKDAAVSDFPHNETLAKVNCGNCHKNPQMQFDAGIHGQALKANQLYAPTCKECHGTHDIITRTSPQSRTYKMKIPFLCGNCHKEGAPVARMYNISEHNILENYSEGIHGQGLFKNGLIVTATCNDCHGNHMVLPASNPKSTIAHDNIASTCMKCHARIEDVHKKVIKRELWEKKAGAVPACSECHPPHIVKIQNIASTLTDKQCMSCHETDQVFKMVDNKKVSLKIDKNEILKSAHKTIGCTKCHTDVTANAKRPCETAGKVDCSNCHTEVSDIYFKSGHGQSYLTKKGDAPYCTDCHNTHLTLSKKDENSPIYRGNVPELCGKCHQKNGKAVKQTTLKEVDAIFDYSTSVHGKGLKEKGLLSSAICIDCHTAHNISKDTVETSTIHPKNIPQTCAQCHKSIYDDYIRSDHSVLNNDKSQKYPNCADCHTAHTITEIDKNKFMTEVTLQCGKCHEKLSKTYLETYHGKAYQLGYLESARCSDCHGAHKILKVSNPNSSVSPQNVLETCRKCHVNAEAEFTGYLSHATHHDKPILSFIFWAMTSLLIGVFLVFGIHTMLWFPRSLKESRKRKHLHPAHEGGKAVYFRRFTTSQRITHVFVIISFLLLAFTGMLLKFAHMSWAAYLADLIGGVPFAGRLHRFAAFLTFGYFAYHVYSLIVMKIKKKLSFKELIFGKNSLMFNKQDLVDLQATIKWFLGKGPRPQYGRWTYWEKFDYMAVFWGVAVIGLSGLFLWFPEFFTRFLPGWAINAAQIVHSDEALLATGFIFTIHFFNTHMRPEAFPLDKVIFTGHIPVEEYKEDRPREYEELEKEGKLDTVIVEREISKSWVKFVKIFGFTALTIGIVLVILIIFSLIFGKY